MTLPALALDLYTLVAFGTNNWPAVAAIAVVLVTLVLLKCKEQLQTAPPHDFTFVVLADCQLGNMS